MGLFSKKTLVCERCHKEYESRVSIGTNYCSECNKIISDKKYEIRGYIKCASDLGLGEYDREEQIDEIIEHRNRIMEKYKLDDVLSREELFDAGVNYKKLSDEAARKISIDSFFQRVELMNGMALSRYFVLPYRYDNVIVDMDDVFAVGFTTWNKVVDGKSKFERKEVLKCILFTNDPYIPVIPFQLYADLGMLEISKSKSVREMINLLFSVRCKNLQYDIQDLPKLEKEIKSEKSVRGNIPYESMRNYISAAQNGSGIFNTKKIIYHEDYKPRTEIYTELENNGYLLGKYIDESLYSGPFTKKFWNNKSNEVENEIYARIGNEQSN